MPAGARIRITRTVGDAELAAQLVPKMRNLTNAIHRRAQRLVPKRTWNLHDTLTSDVEARGAKVVGIVGVGGPTDAAPGGADYWRHVEHGTSRMKAQPYLRPALMQSRPGDLKSSAEPNAAGGRR